MRRVVGLILLMALGLWGCAETNSSGVVDRAALCAMCGASVSPDYFYYSADRSMGPTNR
ncbi:MAG: hypothetical protein M1438_19425 [Deltaproteobacteria bacterium]|nr:hypothetical protein [Deltaproteobacteria bacterium]